MSERNGREPGTDAGSESGTDGGSTSPNLGVRILATVTPNVIRRSFALKFGLVLLVMAVAIGGIGLFATDRISAETQESVETDFENVAITESNVVEEWLTRNRLSVRLLSQNGVWGQTAEDDLELAIQNELAGLGPEVVAMHVVDTDNGTAEIAASSSLEPGEAVAETDRSWIEEARPTLADLQVDDVHVQHTYEAGSEPVVAFASPTSARQGRYLVIEVAVSDIASALQGSSRAEGAFTQVVDAETDEVLIDQRGEDTLSTYASDGTALEPIRRGEDLHEDDRRAGVLTDMPGNQDVIGETYVVGYAPVEGTHWVVVTHAPQASAFGFVQTISDYGLYATLVAVLSIGVIGAMLGYSTSRSIDRLTAKTEAMREGDLDVEFETTRIDNIGRLYDGFAEMRDALRDQITESERARKEAEVARAEAEAMSASLQDKAEEYSEIMQQCAAGDLTQRMETDGENDSMDRIAEEFNEMIEELEKTTGQLKSYVDEVEEAGAEVERSAVAVRQASEQVADSIQRVAVDTEQQRERLDEFSETVDAIAGDLEDIAAAETVDIEESLSRLRDISDGIEELAQRSEETQAETDTVSAAAQEQAAELNEVSERANDLQRYAQPLRDILGRFETESEHEFVFSVGPTGSAATLGVDEDEDD